jgi:hypothetical protein
MVLVCMRHLWPDWTLWRWLARMEVGFNFWSFKDRHQIWEVTTMAETNHWATVCMRASYQLWAFCRQFYWFQSSGLELRFMPSSLEADEAKGYFFFCMTGHMDAVIWSRGSWGWIRQSLVHAVLIPTFSGSYFGPSERCTTERTSSTMHRALLDIQHLQTLRLGDSYVLRPEDEFARLIVDVERGCGNMHLLWTPSAIQYLNDLYVRTLTSLMEYTALCRTMWLVPSD